MPTQTLVRYNPSFLTLLTSTKQQTHHPIQGKVQKKQLSEVLFITTYPPRECGIATYTQDLIRSISKGFGSLSISAFVLCLPIMKNMNILTQ